VAPDDGAFPGVVGAVSAEDERLDDDEECHEIGSVYHEGYLAARDGAHDVEAEDAGGDEGEDHGEEAYQPLPVEPAVEVPVEGASAAVVLVGAVGLRLWSGHRCLLGVGDIKQWSQARASRLVSVFGFIPDLRWCQLLNSHRMAWTTSGV
jgi:hypothetical protein